jgi:hypothetical protein
LGFKEFLRWTTMDKPGQGWTSLDALLFGKNEIVSGRQDRVEFGWAVLVISPFFMVSLAVVRCRQVSLAVAVCRWPAAEDRQGGARRSARAEVSVVVGDAGEDSEEA